MHRFEPAVKHVVIFLGCVVLACGCGEVSGLLDPGGRDDGGGADAELDPPAPSPPSPGNAPVAGETDSDVTGHVGERRQLAVEIAFSDEFGETVTDACGTEYHFDDNVLYEDKVYPEEYWGTFPLYFFGTEVGVTVTVTNLGPRANAKLRVRTEAFVLLTDGSSGAQLAPTREVDVELALGESATIDASFTAEYVADATGMEGGLDRFIVEVLHPNPGRDDAALIMRREGVFCPPELEGDL